MTAASSRLKGDFKEGGMWDRTRIPMSSERPRGYHAMITCSLAEGSGERARFAAPAALRAWPRDRIRGTPFPPFPFLGTGDTPSPSLGEKRYSPEAFLSFG